MPSTYAIIMMPHPKQLIFKSIIVLCAGIFVEVNSDSQYKNYSGWNALRLATISADVARDFMRMTDSNHDLVLLSSSVSQLGHHQVDIGISPGTDLKQLLPTGLQIKYGHPSWPARPSSKGGDGGTPTIKRTSAYNEDIVYILRLLDQEKGIFQHNNPMRYTPKKGTEILDWNNFYRFKSFKKFASSMAKKYPSVATLTLGHTHEGRRVFAMIISESPKLIIQKYKKFVKMKSWKINNILHRKMTDKNIIKERKQLSRNARKHSKNIYKMKKKSNDQYRYYYKERKNKKIKKKKKKKKMKRNKKKKLKNPIIVIEAGIHAREWISPSVAAFIAKSVAEEDDSFLSDASWVIIMVANPDGYEHSHLYDRLWRKNMRPSEDSNCLGVDLNRNWANSWGQSGSSNEPCSNSYHGTSYFSEVESAGIANLVLALKHDIRGYFAVHNYGEKVLYPWGATNTPSERSKILNKTSNYIVSLLNKFGNNTAYVAGQSSHVLYTASGVSTDWVHSQGITHTYTIELPDSGYYGFFTPNEQIFPICDSVWKTMKCFLHVIHKSTPESVCDVKSD